MPWRCLDRPAPRGEPGRRAGVAPDVHSDNRSPILLMDGDLYAVLEERIDLRPLLRRKRREASIDPQNRASRDERGARTRPRLRQSAHDRPS